MSIARSLSCIEDEGGKGRSASSRTPSTVGTCRRWDVARSTVPRAKRFRGRRGRFALVGSAEAADYCLMRSPCTYAFLFALAGAACGDSRSVPRSAISGTPDTVLVYLAASLAKPIRPRSDSIRARNDIVVQRESGASMEHARKITELRRIPDIICSRRRRGLSAVTHARSRQLVGRVRAQPHDRRLHGSDRGTPQRLIRRTGRRSWPRRGRSGRSSGSGSRAGRLSNAPHLQLAERYYQHAWPRCASARERADEEHASQRGRARDAAADGRAGLHLSTMSPSLSPTTSRRFIVPAGIDPAIRLRRPPTRRRTRG